MSGSTWLKLDDLSQALVELLSTIYESEIELVGFSRLSGGANMEIWSMDAVLDNTSHSIILRRMPGGKNDLNQVGNIDLTTEAELITIAADHGVAVPKIVHVLCPSDGLGIGFLMSREPGLALPKRILKDPDLNKTRELLAFECGKVLAKIHSIPLEKIPGSVKNMSEIDINEAMQARLDNYNNASPVHQLALDWLRDNLPAARGKTLVHGDFRNGNMLVDTNGIVAILDWELAHIGNPVEDLGYLCGNVWRFGNHEQPVGGFGQYDDLLDGYRSVAGWAPTVEEIQHWEIYCAMNWAMACLTMLDLYRSGADTSIERAAVGRRLSESEIDLLLLLDGKM